MNWICWLKGHEWDFFNKAPAEILCERCGEVVYDRNELPKKPTIPGPKKWVALQCIFSHSRWYYITHPWLILWHLLRNGWRELRAFIVRGLYGYSAVDIWSLHDYIMAWLPPALRDMAEDSHGWPGEGVFEGIDTPEAWDAALRKLADDIELSAWEHEWSMPEPDDSWLDKFKLYFWALWD